MTLWGRPLREVCSVVTGEMEVDNPSLPGACQ